MSKAWEGRRGTSHPLETSGDIRFVRVLAFGPDADLWLPYVRAAWRSLLLSEASSGVRGYCVPFARMLESLYQRGWVWRRGFKMDGGLNSEPYDVGVLGWAVMR